MAGETNKIELSRSDLRAVARYAVACARPALAVFERERPHDPRPRAAIDRAQAFADGAERTKALRDAAWRNRDALAEHTAAAQQEMFGDASRRVQRAATGRVMGAGAISLAVFGVVFIVAAIFAGPCPD